MRNQSRAEVETATGHVAEVRDDRILFRALDDFYLWGLKHDVSLTPNIMFSGHWESWITSWFTHNINEGDFVIDVGANIGYYTMLFDRLVGLDGSVWAYECNPTLVELLEDTLNYNDSHALLIPEALSDAIGEAVLTFPGDFTGSASLRDEFDPKWGEKTKIEVTTTTLDSDLEYHNRTPDLIKLDVEGAEELAWNGMRRLLAQDDAPVIVLEYTPNAYSKNFTEELFSWGNVTGIGYDGYEHPVNQAFLDGLNDWYMLVIRKR